MLLMIDNYDSFTYNLVQYFGELKAEVKVVRNDELSVEQIEALAPERIVLSPGPCTPNEAGVSLAVIERFAGLANPLTVTRYHSLVVKRESLPECLEVTAWTQHADGSLDEIMGVRHKTLNVEGVQFHPESILTEQGHELLANFLRQQGGVRGEGN